ncbi:MAG: hypothetical protein HYV67_04400 [Candidatus Taylorbacteria bacterium]|nr:hypothetical protein [Candidatus Taylorbacteria bacterium]
MEKPRIRKSRASSSDEARRYRQQGHIDALLFALAIGLNEDYKNDAKAKKDVIDPSGDAHSVKSGEKKWQIFLYSEKRFEEFRVMNGMGQLLIECIKSFPETFEEYQKNKTEAKEKLRPHMVALAEKLQDKQRLKAFMGKSMFNSGEVNYLTVYEKNKFHVFWGKEVEQIMADNFEVANSKARSSGQFPEQKVIFRFEGTNLAELEMRNDSPIHYREMRFNMYKPKAMKLLFSKITTTQNYNKKVILYGEAIKHFGHWKKLD